MDFTVKLAGLVIGVSSLYDRVYRLCREYLSDEAEDFHITVTAEDIESEREKSAREAEKSGQPVIDYPDSYLETLAVYRKIVSAALPYSVWLMHGSAIGVNQEAVLFTAPSGTGKTTHTKLWLKMIPGAFVVNGDKPLLRLRNGTCEVCGTPWAGKEQFERNAILPLRAICVLKRGRENRIRECTFQEVYPTLLQQTYRPAKVDDLSQTIRLTEQIGRCVRFYELSCNMEDEAATVAYQKLFSDKN